MSIWHGFLVEGGGTLVCQLLSKVLTEIKPKYENILKALISTSLVIAGKHYIYVGTKRRLNVNFLKRKIITKFMLKILFLAFDRTGGYYNPALATALKYGCEGNTLKEHVLVYWVGACMGSVIFVLIYHHTPLESFIKKRLEGKKSKDEDSASTVGWDKFD